MQKEYASSAEFSAWYDIKQNEMKNDSVCKFFHDLRTANINTESPKTHRKLSVSIAESVPVSDSVSVKVIRAGKVIQESSSKEREIKNFSINHNTGNSISNNNLTIKMIFEEKPGEDGILLCESYLTKIVILVNDYLK
jgi:hypothetical protein